MPMQYDPKTGVPSFNPFEAELTEGQTPEALPEFKGLVNKLDPFKGDPVPIPYVKISKAEAKQRFPTQNPGLKADQNRGDTIKINRPHLLKDDMPPTTTIEHMADEMLNEVVRKAKPVRNAKPNQVIPVIPLTQQWFQAEIANPKPAQLDNTFTTDEELQDLARQVEDRTIKNWPMLRRLLNRLLRAEGK